MSAHTDVAMGCTVCGCACSRYPPLAIAFGTGCLNMTQEVTSAKPMTVGYLSVVWQNVVKIFLIDLLGAAVVLCTTFVLAVLLYAIAHVVWGLRFHIVAESLL
jgi:hypothetical protein